VYLIPYLWIRVPGGRKAYGSSGIRIRSTGVSFPRERHEQRHKDNDIFQCEDCNKVFKNEKNLRHHYKAHHENPSPGEVSTAGYATRSSRTRRNCATTTRLTTRTPRQER
jgi:hypothetical protein